MFYPDPGAPNEVFTYNDASQQLQNAEAGALQLCLDIDTSGLIQPVEILAQVWKKNLPERKTAVLLLNADNATSRTVAVNVSTVLNLQRLDSSYGSLLGNSSNATERSGDATTGGELTYIVTDVYNRSEADLTVAWTGELRAFLRPQDSAMFLLTPKIAV
jgi:hypothetical protein